MIILKYKLSARLRTTEVYVRGYIDRESYSQNEVLINTFFLGLKIWSMKVWFEDVPEWAIIKRATLGFSDWISKRPNLINACVRNKVIKTITI